MVCRRRNLPKADAKYGTMPPSHSEAMSFPICPGGRSDVVNAQSRGNTQMNASAPTTSAHSQVPRIRRARRPIVISLDLVMNSPFQEAEARGRDGHQDGQQED